MNDHALIQAAYFGCLAVQIPPTVRNVTRATAKIRSLTGVEKPVWGERVRLWLCEKRRTENDTRPIPERYGNDTPAPRKTAESDTEGISDRHPRTRAAKELLLELDISLPSGKLSDANSNFEPEPDHEPAPFVAVEAVPFRDDPAPPAVVGRVDTVAAPAAVLPTPRPENTVVERILKPVAAPSLPPAPIAEPTQTAFAAVVEAVPKRCRPKSAPPLVDRTWIEPLNRDVTAIFRGRTPDEPGLALCDLTTWELRYLCARWFAFKIMNCVEEKLNAKNAHRIVKQFCYLASDPESKIKYMSVKEYFDKMTAVRIVRLASGGKPHEIMPVDIRPTVDKYDDGDVVKSRFAPPLPPPPRIPIDAVTRRALAGATR